MSEGAPEVLAAAIDSTDELGALGQLPHLTDDLRAFDQRLPDARRGAVTQRQHAVELDGVLALGQFPGIHENPVAGYDLVLTAAVFEDCVHADAPALKMS